MLITVFLTQLSPNPSYLLIHSSPQPFFLFLIKQANKQTQLKTNKKKTDKNRTKQANS